MSRLRNIYFLPGALLVVRNFFHAAMSPS
jgi:hypothetical protein